MGDVIKKVQASLNVLKSLFDANTILAANSDNTPAAVTIAEQQIAGRITGGNIKGLSATEVRTLINVADGAAAAFTPTTTSELFEEFACGGTASGSIGLYGWIFEKDGAGYVGLASGLANTIGVLYLAVGATANKGAKISMTDYATGGFALILGTQANLTYICCHKNGQAANAAFTQRVGLTTCETNAEPVRGIYFRASGTGNWYAVTRSAATETATDTGVAQATTFKEFKIVINSAGNSVAFYIDGNLVATHTTNLPSAGLTPVFQIDNTDTTDRYITIDYAYLKLTGLTR